MISSSEKEEGETALLLPVTDKLSALRGIKKRAVVFHRRAYTADKMISGEKGGVVLTHDDYQTLTEIARGVL